MAAKGSRRALPRSCGAVRVRQRWSPFLKAVVRTEAAVARGTLSRHLQVMREAVEVCEVDVNQRAITGGTALHLASVVACPQLVDLLLDLGADPYAVNGTKETPLHHAAAFGDVGVIEALLDKAPYLVHEEDANGATALHWAAQAKDSKPEVVRILLRFYADIDAVNHQKDTALHCAAREGTPEIVAVLLDAGADVGKRNDQAEIPFFSALKSGHIEVAKMINCHHKHGEAPVSYSTSVIRCRSSAGF